MSSPLALIPYLQLPVYNLGPIPLDPWGILVTIGFMGGLEVARARGIKLGLDVRDVVDGLVFVVLSGFVVGHLVHILAYNPHKMQEDPYILIKVWAGFSSFGGFLGAILGMILFFKVIRKRPFWPIADTIMFAFPFAWVFGRLGCFSVHDHIGIPSTFFLAVDFPKGPRLDMGLIEALWTAVICGVYLLVARRPYRPGTFAVLWCFLYAPGRFGMDFLRSVDVRWAGLTPAQWGCILLLVAGALLANKVRKTPVYVVPTTP